MAQVGEEQVHAGEFAEHMLNRGATPLIQSLHPSGLHARLGA